MSRSTWSRVYAVAAIAAAIAASVWAVGARTHASIEQLFFFALLVAVACYLRIDDDPSTAGFEAAVVFAAVPLLHDPAAGIFPVFLGATIWALQRPRLESFRGAARLALSY